MNTFYKCFVIAFLFIVAVGLAPFSHAEEYNLFYGARLTEANGAPILGQDGKLDLEVSFYSAGTGGSPIGSSPISFPGTTISEGVFQLSIALTPAEFHQVFQDPSMPVYIEVKDVKNGAVFPRQRFSVTPFALKTPIDNNTLVYDSDGKLTVGSSVGTVKQITAGSGLTGGTISDSGTITVDAGSTGNKIVQLSDGKLPSVDGSNLSSVNAEKLQTRNVSAAVPVSGQVLKWSGSAWVPSSDLVGETGSGEANTASNVTSASGVGLFKAKVSADLSFYSLSPGAGVTVTLVGDDVVVASTITQYTDAMAKAAAVADSIADSITNVAPSQNAVFDALAAKQASVTTSTDLSLNSITTNAVNAITVNPGVSTGEIKLKELSVNGTNYVGLKAPGSIPSDLTLTLPGSLGTNGQFLKTDGSGNLSWTDQATAPVTSVNTLTGAVTLTTTNIAEGTNLYYTDARAKTASVGDAITDAVTDKAPSQNSVFDALALKSASSHNHSGVYEPVGLSTDVVTTTKILNDAVTSAKIASGVDSAKIGSGAVDNTEFGYLNGVTSAIQTQLDVKVVGPASATDNAIARFDGTTGKLVQNSGVAINDSGNVGISTTSPTMKLHVLDSVGAGTQTLQGLRLEGNSNTYYDIGRDASGGSSTGYLKFWGSQSSYNGYVFAGVDREFLRITNAGNMGIGTTSPVGKLDVQGGRSYFAAGSEQYGLGVKYSTSGGAVFFGATSNSATPDAAISNAGGGTLMTLQNGGNVGLGTTSPSMKLHVLDTVGAGTQTLQGLRLEGNSSTYYDIGRDASGGSSTAYLKFWGSQSGSNGYVFAGVDREFLRITNTGNVGIGTTNPGQKLSVVGTVESTSGGFKFPDGSLQSVAGFGNLVTRTSVGTSTWTVPAGVTRVKVTVVGGGGGGLAGSTGNVSGAGGGGGGYSIGVIGGLTSGSSISYTVGGGGAGGTTDFGEGSAGGSSSFGPANGTTITATGGNGGTQGGGGGLGGTGSGGNINGSGEDGEIFTTASTTNWVRGGQGGSSILGGGGSAGSVAANCSYVYNSRSGKNYGGGGGGGAANTACWTGGGNGAQGVIIIEY